MEKDFQLSADESTREIEIKKIQEEVRSLPNQLNQHWLFTNAVRTRVKAKY
jgi:hypothetical protein